MRSMERTLTTTNTVAATSDKQNTALLFMLALAGPFGVAYHGLTKRLLKLPPGHDEGGAIQTLRSCAPPAGGCLAQWPPGYRPLNTGSRFSRNEFRPSTASSELCV
jgi:hypothetical protein